jgi:hypothetical protein
MPMTDKSHFDPCNNSLVYLSHEAVSKFTRRRHFWYFKHQKKQEEK